MPTGSAGPPASLWRRCQTARVCFCAPWMAQAGRCCSQRDGQGEAKRRHGDQPADVAMGSRAGDRATIPEDRSKQTPAPVEPAHSSAASSPGHWPEGLTGAQHGLAAAKLGNCDQRALDESCLAISVAGLESDLRREVDSTRLDAAATPAGAGTRDLPRRVAHALSRCKSVGYVPAA